MFEGFILLPVIIGFVVFIIYLKTSELSEPPSYKAAHKTKAQSEDTVKDEIENFPIAKVKWVIDGDTVIVIQGWSEIVIRLDSIDCPEDGQDWGDTAKYGLIKLIGRCNVRLEEHGPDDYGRTLATIYVWHKHKSEWLNVNERMVTLGHAWVMRKFYDHLPQDRQEKLNRLERWAKSKKVGLWRDPNPIPPWQWRMRDKQY
jgi:endonuclease YncB( thermonuclease family)